MRTFNSLFVAVVLLLYGCSRNIQTETQTIEVDLSASHIVDLENNPPLKGAMAILQEPLGLIQDFYFVDSVYIIRSGGKMYRFDVRGSFLGGISSQGRGSNEYLSIDDSWIEEDKVFMWDINNKQVLKYSLLDGEISTTALSPDAGTNPFASLIPMKSGGYVGEMIFQGTADSPPELALYNDDFLFMSRIGDMKRNSGLTLGRTLSQYEDEVLYWRKLENTIYTIDNQGNIRPKWLVDFIGHNVPEPQEGEDDYDRLDLINSKPTFYATLLSDVIESDNGLLFTYVHNGYKYLACYDKRKKRIDTFAFQTSAADVKADIFITSPDNICVYVPEDDHSTIYRIDLPALLRQTK